MKFLERVFAFYINSSIHVALAVVALLAITVVEYNLTVSKQFWAFVFLAALTGYNFVKYAKVAGLHHRSLTYSLKLIQVFSAVCFVLLVYFAVQLRIEVLLLTLGFGMATFLYAVPVIRNKNLRNCSGFKIFIVAFVWAGVTVILPFVASKAEITPDVYLTFFQRILLVVALILPFEIRDVPYDWLNLKTLPQQFGIRNTKLLGQIILLCCLIIEFYKAYSDIPYLTSLLVFCVVLGWLLVISKTRQTRYFASFWIEGLPIMWLLLYLLFEQF